MRRQPGHGAARRSGSDMQRGPPPPRASSVPSMVITVRCLASVQSSNARKLTAGTTRKPAAWSSHSVCVVPPVADDRARPHRQKVAGRAPLLALLAGAVLPAGEHGSSGRPTSRRASKKLGISRTAASPLPPVQHRQALRSHEERRIDHAQLAVHLGEDHVEMDRRRRLGHHHDQHVGHRALGEHRVAQLVERGRRGPLAEAEHQEVGPEVVHVPAFERVVAAPLLRPVVQEARVGQLRMKGEQRLDQQLLGPADIVAHRPDHRVAADDHTDVAGKEQIGQRRKGEPLFVERLRQGPALLPGALDQHVHDLGRRQGAQALAQLVGRQHVHGLGDEELARVGLGQDLGQEVPHLEHGGESPQHRDELPVFALGDLEVDDVVVEIIFAIARRHRLELDAGCVHQHGLQRADFGGDVDRHRRKYSGGLVEG